MTYNRAIIKEAVTGVGQAVSDLDAFPDGKRLLIYAPVPLFRKDGQLFVEAQARNGLRLWAENFAHVTVLMPVEEGEPPTGWQPVDEMVLAQNRIVIEPLPTAYRPDRFLRSYRGVRTRIRDLIDRSDLLSFAIGGLFGDWGSVACLEAHKLGRPYAVWTDRVESQVMLHAADHGSFQKRLRARLYHRPMAALERYVIRLAEVGLFHGKDTFDFYAPFCKNPVLVHDIHIAKDDHIPAADLAGKIARASDGPLRLAYVGRADTMKGPLDWVEVLERLDADGVDFHATWLGDGEDLPRMKARVQAAGLSDRVSLPGFSNDRKLVLETLRAAHVFLFCHRTPESPRCLIEALTSGCPIVGYTSAFASDLIAGHHGGRLVRMGDTAGLSAAVAEMARDRGALAGLIGAAAQDGSPFDDVSVFRHRSEVIKAFL